MFIIEFGGGLGNQLFQLAMAKYLQERFHEEIVCDVTQFTHDSREYRDFELDSFSLPQNWSFIRGDKSKYEVYGLRYYIWAAITFLYQKTYKLFDLVNLRKWYGRIYQHMINIFGIYCVMNYYEDYYVPRKSLWKRKIVLGNWLWPDMVKQNQEWIKNNVFVNTEISEANQKILTLINKTNSVAVHIRRGDFVTLGLIVCSIRYYEMCIAKMCELEVNPTFFIFSDDIKWCKSNLKTNATLIFVDNSNSTTDDFRLMYSSKHFIISSSTYSWWASYLGKYSKKKIISPLHWNVCHDKINPLILEDMITIENRGI